MNDSTTLSQLPHGSRYVVVPGDFPTGEPGTLLYRRQLVDYFRRDPVSAERYRRRPLTITPRDTVGTVVRKLGRVLQREQLHDQMDYLSPSNAWDRFPASTRWTEIPYRWIAVFPVTGGNEGIYIHVNAVVSNGRPGGWDHCHLALAKVWDWEAAWQITRRFVELLGA